MSKVSRSDIPDGYIPGMSRLENGNKKVSHLYKGDFENPGFPMCRRGWNRDDGSGYSIFRNVISGAGVCGFCLNRAKNGLSGVV